MIVVVVVVIVVSILRMIIINKIFILFESSGSFLNSHNHRCTSTDPQFLINPIHSFYHNFDGYNNRLLLITIQGKDHVVVKSGLGLLFVLFYDTEDMDLYVSCCIKNSVGDTNHNDDDNNNT